MFIEYLITFLLGEENVLLTPLVSYGYCKTAKVVILPSKFFGRDYYLTKKSIPSLPLQELDGVPILFGTPELEIKDNQLYIYADLIASAFFLLTRYEECLLNDIRDQHGRFMGKNSLPYRAGFIKRPIVDEYGILLRRCLRRMGVNVCAPKKEFSHIYLTHDVDNIWTWDNYYYAIRTSVKRILSGKQNKFQPLYAVMNYKKYDPLYTFPWLVAQDNSVKEIWGETSCTSLYFFMGCLEKTGWDAGYLSNHVRTADLINYLHEKNCTIGYHVSYAASLSPSLMKSEILRISELANIPCVLSRNHFLASREPQDYREIIKAGITDDFTMAYADVAGFRLGTCRPVRWIDPSNCELTSLTLHPMTVMECTLDGPDYMNIKDEEEAFYIVKELLDNIYIHGGEVVLLWHNNSVAINSGSYHRILYKKTLSYLKQFYNK